MNRDEIIYQSVALYAGPTPATGDQTDIKQLHRVDTFNSNFDIPSEDVLQFGQLRAFTREVNDSPTPTFSFEYYLTNGINEKRLGFNIDGATSMISDILTKVEDEKNYFALFVPEGNDAVGFTDRSEHVVEALGNGFITNIEFSVNVGEFARGSVDIEGDNYVIHVGSSGNPTPALDPTDGSKIEGITYVLPLPDSGESGMPKVIKYGDVELNLSDAEDLMGATLDGDGKAHIQGFTLSVPLDREPLNRLGNKFSYSRKINFPIEANLNIEAIVSEMNTGNLFDIIDGCSQKEYDFDITAKACVNGDKEEVMNFLVRGAVLQSQDFSLSVGDRRTVSIPFTISIGGPQDTKGIFLSGSHIGS